MDCLIYRYNNVYECSVIDTFNRFGLNCIEELSGMASYANDKSRIEVISEHIVTHIKDNNPLLFVFSINFFPDISEVCERLGVLYVCWSVDCPVLELFSNSIRNKHNRIFLFDRAQYNRISPYNPDCTFYLPLATDLQQWDKVLSSVSEEDLQKYSSDISFVGSLYNEKNPIGKLELDEHTRGFVDAVVASQIPIFGSFILENSLTDDITAGIVTDKPVEPVSGFVEPVDRYVAANNYLAIQTAVKERTLTLNMLSEKYNVSLYTGSDTSALPMVHNMGTAETLTEMPKIFRLSKINLNMTLRSINTGIPLRVFDVLGCGGFLISNYQEELLEYFDPGVDLEIYASLEELCDKCKFYLEHDDIRNRIALNGYNKIKASHTIEIRMAKMLSYLTH